MHQTFVSTAPPPAGMGGDNDSSLFIALVICTKLQKLNHAHANFDINFDNEKIDQTI